MRFCLLIFCLTLPVQLRASDELPQPEVAQQTQSVFSSAESVFTALGTLIFSVVIASLTWRAYKELIDPHYIRFLNYLKACHCCRRATPPVQAQELPQF